MGRLYENSPIIEALCDFRFEPSQPWDWTIPGLVYDKVKQEFPTKQQQNLVEVELRPEPQELPPTVRGGVARMQFVREDKSALLQIGPDQLIVNHLKPYPTWRVFRQLIADALADYLDVVKPIGIARIELRYINRIDIPEATIEIEDYILTVPNVPKEIPQLFATWGLRVEIPIPDSNGVLVIQSGRINQQYLTAFALLLDFDFVLADSRAVTMESAMTWIDHAHDEIERAFEACITEKTRGLFKEVVHEH
jgi:uncharacterized protein (TIGR04255 family)